VRKQPKPVLRLIYDVGRGGIEVHKVSIAPEHRLDELPKQKVNIRSREHSPRRIICGSRRTMAERHYVYISGIPRLQGLDILQEAAA
jgi:hypothetical protein